MPYPLENTLLYPSVEDCLERCLKDGAGIVEEE